MNVKRSYGLFAARVHIIVMIVTSISNLFQVKTKIINANIVEMRLGITSSQTLFSTMY